MERLHIQPLEAKGRGGGAAISSRPKSAPPLGRQGSSKSDMVPARKVTPIKSKKDSAQKAKPIKSEKDSAQKAKPIKSEKDSARPENKTRAQQKETQRSKYQNQQSNNSNDNICWCCCPSDKTTRSVPLTDIGPDTPDQMHMRDNMDPAAFPMTGGDLRNSGSSTTTTQEIKDPTGRPAVIVTIHNHANHTPAPQRTHRGDDYF